MQNVYISKIFVVNLARSGTSLLKGLNLPVWAFVFENTLKKLKQKIGLIRLNFISIDVENENL